MIATRHPVKPALSARASLNVILTLARPLLTPFEHRSYQGFVQ